jgi:hypothetical protein
MLMNIGESNIMSIMPVGETMMPVGQTMMPVGEKMMTVGENLVRASRLWLAAPFFNKNTIESFQDISICQKRAFCSCDKRD